MTGGMRIIKKRAVVEARVLFVIVSFDPVMLSTGRRLASAVISNWAGKVTQLPAKDIFAA